jgi:hypothetical protein
MISAAARVSQVEGGVAYFVIPEYYFVISEYYFVISE